MVKLHLCVSDKSGCVCQWRLCVVSENMDSLVSQIIRFIHLHLIASVLPSRWSSRFFTAFLLGIAVSTDDSIFLSPTWWHIGLITDQVSLHLPIMISEMSFPPICTLLITVSDLTLVAEQLPCPACPVSKCQSGQHSFFIITSHVIEIK